MYSSIDDSTPRFTQRRSTRELSAMEIEEVNGGAIPAVVIAASKLAGSAFLGGFFAAAGAYAFHWLVQNP